MIQSHSCEEQYELTSTAHVTRTVTMANFTENQKEASFIWHGFTRYNQISFVLKVQRDIWLWLVLACFQHEGHSNFT